MRGKNERCVISPTPLNHKMLWCFGVSRVKLHKMLGCDSQGYICDTPTYCGPHTTYHKGGGKKVEISTPAAMGGTYGGGSSSGQLYSPREPEENQTKDPDVGMKHPSYLAEAWYTITVIPLLRLRLRRGNYLNYSGTGTRARLLNTSQEVDDLKSLREVDDSLSVLLTTKYTTQNPERRFCGSSSPEHPTSQPPKGQRVSSGLKGVALRTAPDFQSTRRPDVVLTPRSTPQSITPVEGMTQQQFDASMEPHNMEADYYTLEDLPSDPMALPLPAAPSSPWSAPDAPSLPETPLSPPDAPTSRSRAFRPCPRCDRMVGNQEYYQHLDSHRGAMPPMKETV